jgi:nicotinate-nucleotide pyrophosphorylase
MIYSHLFSLPQALIEKPSASQLNRAGSIGCAIKSAIQKYPNLPLIVEVENLTQLQQVLPLDGVERVLCLSIESQR